MCYWMVVLPWLLDFLWGMCRSKLLPFDRICTRWWNSRVGFKNTGICIWWLVCSTNGKNVRRKWKIMPIWYDLVGIIKTYITRRKVFSCFVIMMEPGLIWMIIHGMDWQKVQSGLFGFVLFRIFSERLI